MARTSLGYFLQSPHMHKACNDCETAYPPDLPGMWLNFKQFFTKKFFNYQNHQASLSNAGIASIISSSAAINSMHAELAELCAANQTKDEFHARHL